MTFGGSTSAALVMERSHCGWQRPATCALFLAVWLFASAWVEADTLPYHLIDLTPAGSNFASAQGISGGGQIVGWNGGSAVVWNGTSNLVSLGGTVAYGSDGAQQVGRKLIASNHAALWNGTAASMVDLNPNGWFGSQGMGVANGQQVGFGAQASNSRNHALLWTGTAGSFVDLNPTGFRESIAFGTTGATQVGQGQPGPSNAEHALVWSGSAASAMDINPADFTGSIASAIHGTQIVGEGGGVLTGNQFHAVIFTPGVGSGYIDLNPLGFAYSRAEGTNGVQQVGFGSTTGGNVNDLQHALVWSGSAGSFVDLHSYLPSKFVQSYAFGIDANGDVVGEGIDAAGNFHAFEWAANPVPLPSSFSAGIALLFGSAIVLRRKRIGFAN